MALSSSTAYIMLKDDPQSRSVPTVPIAEEYHQDAERLGPDTGCGGYDPGREDDGTAANRDRTIKRASYAARLLKGTSCAG